jgi:hypothetical protein
MMELTKQQHVSSVKTCSKESRLLEDILQVVLLASVLGNPCAELKIDSHTSGSDDHTRYPKEESKTNTARQLQDPTGRSEDSGADHAIEDQESCRHDADLALVGCCFGMFALAYDRSVSQACPTYQTDNQNNKPATPSPLCPSSNAQPSTTPVLKTFDSFCAAIFELPANVP